MASLPAQVLQGSFETVCPLCGSASVTIYADEKDQDLAASSIGSSRRDVSHGRILRCKACGFGFRQLRPADYELSSLYRDLDPEMYEREGRGRSQTARHHLKIVQRFVNGGNLLDVGCASGIFLRQASEAGWRVVGVEPSRVLFAKAEELLGDRGHVHCTTLQQANLPAASFDAVTLWDVLEHVPDPLAFIRRCTVLLRPDGYLFVNVPDLDSTLARLFGRRWPLLLAEHLNYFNRASLRLCGEKAQLQLLHFGQRPAHFSVEYVLYRLEQHKVMGAKLCQRVVGREWARNAIIPVWLGETFAVWRKSADSN